MTALIVNPYETDLTKFAEALNQHSAGRSNATGSFTLTPNVTSTDVEAVNCGEGSVVLFSPLTANAAAAQSTTFVSVVEGGLFTVTHASAASVDRTFGFVALG